MSKSVYLFKNKNFFKKKKIIQDAVTRLLLYRKDMTVGSGDDHHNYVVNRVLMCVIQNCNPGLVIFVLLYS